MGWFEKMHPVFAVLKEKTDGFIKSHEFAMPNGLGQGEISARRDEDDPHVSLSITKETENVVVRQTFLFFPLTGHCRLYVSSKIKSLAGVEGCEHNLWETLPTYTPEDTLNSKLGIHHELNRLQEILEK